MDKLKRLIAEQFPAPLRDEVYALVEPFTEGGTRIARCILQLSGGSKARVEHYAECARQDFRDVILWAENPEEAALNTPQKIEEFQDTLTWLGLPRDNDLDRTRDQLLAAQQAAAVQRAERRPRWRFW